MRDQKDSKLFTLKNSKLYPPKTNEILGFINQKLSKSSGSCITNSNFNSFEQLTLLMISIFNKINILVHKINKLDARLRMTFKDSINGPSNNFEDENLPNVKIEFEKADQIQEVDRGQNKDTNQEFNLNKHKIQFTSLNTYTERICDVKVQHEKLNVNTSKLKEKNKSKKKKKAQNDKKNETITKKLLKTK